MSLKGKISTIGIMVVLGRVSVTAMAADSMKFALDPNHTQVYITWNHLGFSNPGASSRSARER